jgi:hypothetical protein
MDAEVDTGVEGAPAVSGSFMAAGPWTQPTGLPLGRDAGAEARARRGLPPLTPPTRN